MKQNGHKQHLLLNSYWLLRSNRTLLFLIFASGLGKKTSGLIMMGNSRTLSCLAEKPSLVPALSRASIFMIIFSSLLLWFLKSLAALLLLV